MKKSKPPVSKITPKEISIKRLSRSKLMKIAIDEGNFRCNDKILVPLNIKHTSYKIRDRNIKDSPGNPFIVPDHMRVFTKNISSRKVRKEPFIMSEPETICDIDSSFYKIVEGRPLRQFRDVKVYMSNLRDITLFRTNTAFMKQQIIAIDTKHTEELNEYNKILHFYDRTKENFKQFAKESYLYAKAIQKKAEEVAEKKALMKDKFERYNFKFVEIRNKISDIYYRYCTLLMYKKFFISISPNYWLAEFGPSHNNEDVLIPEISTSSIVLPSSSAMMEVYKNCIETFEPATMYFETPEKLINFYEDMRLQSLNYMHIDVITSKLLKSLLSYRDLVKYELKLSFEDVEDLIERYERKVVYLEEKADTFKSNFFKILMSECQKLYSSYDSIKLFNCIQYVHKQIYGGHEDPRDSVVTMWNEIETRYITMTVALDGMNQEIVKAVTKRLFTEDINIMNRALKAHRTIKESDILRKALYTSFEPPRNNKERSRK